MEFQCFAEVSGGFHRRDREMRELGDPYRKTGNRNTVIKLSKIAHSLVGSWKDYCKKKDRTRKWRPAAGEHLWWKCLHMLMGPWRKFSWKSFFNLLGCRAMAYSSELDFSACTRKTQNNSGNRTEVCAVSTFQQITNHPCEGAAALETQDHPHLFALSSVPPFPRSDLCAK